MTLEEEFLSCTSARIEKRLTEAFCPSVDDHAISALLNVCRHLCQSSSAKRARPLLCYYYWLFEKEDFGPELVDIAVAAEFIHAASLLHDDVIDEAGRRRGKETANRVFGNSVAVLGGNYLLTEAFRLLAPYDRRIVDKSIDVIARMTHAAILEINSRNRVDVCNEIYQAIAIGKTGELFSWCGFAAATLLGSDKLVRVFSDLGPRLGKIFQMADDLKDFDGDKNLKDQCRDIRNREPSLPLILAMQHDPIKHEFLKASGELTDGDVQHLRDLVVKSGALEKTKMLIRGEIHDLFKKLEPFNNRPGKIRLERWVYEIADINGLGV